MRHPAAGTLGRPVASGSNTPRTATQTAIPRLDYVSNTGLEGEDLRSANPDEFELLHAWTHFSVLRPGMEVSASLIQLLVQCLLLPVLIVFVTFVTLSGFFVTSEYV